MITRKEDGRSYRHVTEGEWVEHLLFDSQAEFDLWAFALVVSVCDGCGQLHLWAEINV